MLAARSGNTPEVKKLVSEGADVDAQSLYGWTALMFAAWKGHSEPVSILLDAGADPNIVSSHVPSSFETFVGHPPSTALQEAIRNGNLSIATTLIDNGANIDPESVALAGGTGNVGFLHRLTQKGADLNQPSENAFYATPLCAAAAHGKLGAVKWLIENGADPNLIAFDQTALKKGALNNKVNMVRYLLEHGADPNVVYSHLGETVLFDAVTNYTDAINYSKNLAIIEMLVSHGADVNQRARDGKQTALQVIANQRENGLKYIKKETDEEVLARLHASLAHEDGVIALLLRTDGVNEAAETSAGPQGK